MKWKIALLIAIVVGAFGGSWIKNLPGFVIIAYDKTSYEMRLWIAVSLLLLLLSVLFLIGMFLRSLISSANKMKGWQGERHWRKARKQTIKGMLAFVEGRWKQSENTMINAAKNSDTKLINYLIAAQSAQHQDAEDRRDTYLRLAHKAEPSADVAIGLTQAQLQLDNQQYEQALATLNELKLKTPNHPFILKLLCKTYQKLQDWDAIIELLPALKKQKVFPINLLETLEVSCVSGILQKKSVTGELESLNNAWLKLPNSSRKNNQNILCYTKLLLEFEQMDVAEKMLKPLFKKAPNKETILLFADIKSTNGNKQFSFLESWFNGHQQAPNAIYLALGKLAFNISLWGKARFYFERSLRSEPNAEAFFMMASTLEKLDDYELAMECYRQGLEFVVHPERSHKPLLLDKGSEDLVSANLLPKFEKE